MIWKLTSTTNENRKKDLGKEFELNFVGESMFAFEKDRRKNGFRTSPMVSLEAKGLKLWAKTRNSVYEFEQVGERKEEKK